MPSGDETWTEERVDQLTLLWDEGVTTAEIGRRIGVTKNAVIGKVHRLGLVPRVIVERPLTRARRLGDFPDGNRCRYSFGHPGDDDWHFCGAPATGPDSPYCAEHHALTHLKQEASRDLWRKAVAGVR